MIRGYARVSTDRQDLTMQLEAFEAAGVEKTYRDKITGTKAERPALRRLLRDVEDGDQVVVFKIDRIARSTRDALNIIHELTDRGVAFRSIHEAMIDTTAITADGDLLNAAMKTAMLQMMAVFAELERAFIVARTAEGRRIARGNGVKFGRPFALTSEQVATARELLATGTHTHTEVARTLGVRRETLWRYLKALEAS